MLGVPMAENNALATMYAHMVLNHHKYVPPTTDRAERHIVKSKSGGKFSVIKPRGA